MRSLWRLAVALEQNSTGQTKLFWGSTRAFSWQQSTPKFNASRSSSASYDSRRNGVRLSKVLSTRAKNIVMSRNEAERLIRTGRVTWAGELVTQPGLLVDIDKVQDAAFQVNGKPIILHGSHSAAEQLANKEHEKSRVWLARKMPGELVTENDPQGRPSMMDRLMRSGVGKLPGRNHRSVHLKPVGRLDMPTEGLIIITNDGEYARQMEMPKNKLHRTYRVRVHGPLTSNKLTRLRRGMVINNTHYAGMQVEIEEKKRKTTSTNTWIKLTCVEGKNRMIRKVFDHLGLTVARLIRISYGDYKLPPSLPAGMAMEVRLKPIASQKCRGRVSKPQFVRKRRPIEEEKQSSPIQWVKYH